MDFKDYYATLGLTKTATDKEIKQAFRKLARKYHPDVNPGDKAAEARFKEINEANEVLSDADKRRKYDELGANWRAYENVPPGAQGFPGGFSGFGGFQGRGAGTYTTGSGGQYRTDVAGGDGGAPRRQRRRLLGLLHDVLRRRRRGQRRRAADARAQPAAAPAPISSTPCSSRSRRRTTARCAGISLKHDGHTRAIDVRIPAGVRDGARVRVVRRGRARRQRRTRRRSLPAGAGAAARPLRAAGRRPDDARRGAADDRGARRRGGGDDAGRHDRAAEGAADDAERPEVPGQGPRHARAAASPRNAGISTSSPTSSCPAR